jgi:vacuolar protein sorting-associated protein 45
MSNSPETNLLPIAEEYFKTIFADITGMKAILLDAETLGIISVIYSQSKLFKHDIYLIQKIAERGDKMPHLKALYFVRPTKENLDMIITELKDPRFQDYHLFFTNEISSQFIETLATNDPNDRIKTLQEVYLDFFAIGRNVFTLNIPSTVSLIKPKE